MNQIRSCKQRTRNVSSLKIIQLENTPVAILTNKPSDYNMNWDQLARNHRPGQVKA